MQDSPRATLLQAARAHAGEVAALDARGALLVTAGGGALRAWRWQPGAGWRPGPEARQAHRYGVAALRLARAGALLASGGVDGAVRVWCARSLRPRRALVAPGAAGVRALCWAGGGGARLLAGHDDGALCAWRPARGELLARWPAHEGALHALAAPAAGRLLLSACTHGVLKVWDLAEALRGGAAPAPLQWVDGAHDLGALCADASEAGGAATGGQDGAVRLWAVEGSGSGARLAAAGTLAGHAAAVTALRWARGEVLASASLDRTARLWARGACLLAVAAHPRYVTAVALAPDLGYMITGSNDKTVRMWSLGALSLEDELTPPCDLLAHFALGDLEGIEAVDEESDVSAEEEGGEGDSEAGASGASLAWRAEVHAGAINCIAAHDTLLATAASDGAVKVWQWSEEEGAPLELHTLAAGEYPAMAADLGAAGSVLLSAGLDGAAHLWDVRSGVCVRSLVVSAGCGGEAGGGGVRGARLSPHAAPRALLATDDGLVPLWTVTDPDPRPQCVYAGHAEAATCCAWSHDGRAAASGAASGELRVYAPPDPAPLHHDSHAHDLGVLSCDFAPLAADLELEEDEQLLASGGCDSLVKLWSVRLDGEGGARVELAGCVQAHGGAVASVRWGAAAGSAALLGTAGADRWARVWRVRARGRRTVLMAAVPVRGAGGAPAAALLAGARLLAVGSLGGELAVWRLASAERGTAGEDDGADAAYWDEAGVARWLRERVLSAPELRVGAERAAELEARVRSAALTGTRLLDEPVDELLDALALECEAEDGAGALRAAVREELLWLRAPPYPPDLEARAPHWALCPVSHRVLAECWRAADGFSYERGALLEHAAAARRSPATGRGLRAPAPAPNRALQRRLRAFLAAAGLAPPGLAAQHPAEPDLL